MQFSHYESHNRFDDADYLQTDWSAQKTVYGFITETHIREMMRDCHRFNDVNYRLIASDISLNGDNNSFFENIKIFEEEMNDFVDFFTLRTVNKGIIQQTLENIWKCLYNSSNKP